MLTSIEQMEANVAKFKHDIEMSKKQYDTDIRKFIVQVAVAAVATVATCVGAGIALATYVEHRR